MTSQGSPGRSIKGVFVPLGLEAVQTLSTQPLRSMRDEILCEAPLRFSGRGDRHSVECFPLGEHEVVLLRLEAWDSVLPCLTDLVLTAGDRSFDGR